MADVRPESLKRITTKALADEFIADQLKAIKEQVGDKKVLLALSGGVDSSVVAALRFLVSHISHFSKHWDNPTTVLYWSNRHRWKPRKLVP